MFESRSIKIFVAVLFIAIFIYAFFILRDVRAGASIVMVEGQTYLETSEDRVEYLFNFKNISDVYFQGEEQIIKDDLSLDLSLYPHLGLNNYILEVNNSFGKSKQLEFYIYKTSKNGQ